MITQKKKMDNGSESKEEAKMTAPSNSTPATVTSTSSPPRVTFDCPESASPGKNSLLKKKRGFGKHRHPWAEKSNEFYDDDMLSLAGISLGDASCKSTKSIERQLSRAAAVYPTMTMRQGSSTSDLGRPMPPHRKMGLMASQVTPQPVGASVRGDSVHTICLDGPEDPPPRPAHTGMTGVIGFQAHHHNVHGAQTEEEEPKKQTKW
eukprot:CAMPEP_0116824394 /NCGR_PEP_ID=MMETSP0418-20121206/1375_1 /TAXON_ID=1158023 /ORGANISM="Astrosyne radiata, Strain 13vi08-1A" /LENGTH=205 /DNA_ID=CAMNT_0004452765 /DNA_START=1986 /DNA_END=2600 /DNA_ORIENTATION=-